jgi:hypothetical protein
MKSESMQIPVDIQKMPKTEQTQIKGGLLLYCEEKRRPIGGGRYVTVTEFKMKDDGKQGLTIQM